MPLLLLLASVVLGVSAYLAPRHYAARETTVDASALLEADGSKLVAMGEGRTDDGLPALGCGLAGARLKNDANLRLLYALKLWGVAPQHPNLAALVAEEMRDYLLTRAASDPDGTHLRAAIDVWFDLRLANEEFTHRRSPAVWLSARGDQRGVDEMWRLSKMGPLHQVYFPFLQQIHANWLSVQPFVEYYLEKGDLSGRIWAALTLHEYHSLWQVGAPVIERFDEVIRKSIREALRVVDGRPIFMVSDLAVYRLLALRNERKLLASIRITEAGGNVDLLRIARILCGMRPFDDIEIGTLQWKLLAPESQSYYFQAARHDFVRLTRKLFAAEGKQREELEPLQKAAQERVEAALDSKSITLQCNSFHVLMGLGGEYAKRLSKRFLDAGGVQALFASAVTKQKDPAPNVIAAMLRQDYGPLAAVILLYPDRPTPVMPPPDLR